MHTVVSAINSIVVPATFLVSILCIVVGSIFHKKYFKFFYAGLIGTAISFYVWGVVSVLAPAMYFAPHYTSPGEQVLNVTAVTALYSTLYGLIGLAVCGVRALLKYSTKRLFVYSLAAFLVGIAFLIGDAFTPRGIFRSNQGLPTPIPPNSIQIGH